MERHELAQDPRHAPDWGADTPMAISKPSRLPSSMTVSSRISPPGVERLGHEVERPGLAGPATGSRPPSRRERSRSARVVNGRLRYNRRGRRPDRAAVCRIPCPDSMSCRRRAKQHGTETSADTPGSGRPCFSRPPREADLRRHGYLSQPPHRRPGLRGLRSRRNR